MRRPLRFRTALLRAACLAITLLASPRTAPAAEGKWTPEQVLQLDPAWLRAQGLALAPEELWGREGAGLLEAAVRITGCSAGFISDEGLLVTNHHCAFSILQQHSTPERDLIADGFLARSRSEELAGGGVRATVPHSSRDVTSEIGAAVPRGADDLARFRAIERKQKELVAACERQESRRCEVATYDGGVRYVLFESLEFPDVRLVYAPPRAVGEYGGEVDNWSWPRHNGDFSLLRVWAAPDGKPAARAAANVPYRPRHHFPVSAKGVAPGAFVMVAGYPGVTYRSLTEAEMRERAERFFPGRAAMYRAWLDVLESASASGDAARIALADRTKTLANREKNSRGQVEGIRRWRLVEQKHAGEQAVLAWAAAHSGEAGEALAAHAELERLMAERLRTWDRDFLLSEADRGAKPLDLALTLARWARERAKPDPERDPNYQERNRSRLEEPLRLDQKRFWAPAEEALLADQLARFAALPAGSRVPAVDRLFGSGGAPPTPEEARARAAALLAGSKVMDLDERMKMAGETLAQLQARHDPLLDFAVGLDEERLAWKEREDRFKGALARLRPAWRRAVEGEAGKPIAPDANTTLRVSFAHVEGYSPRDAVRYTPQTTLAGLVEKHTGKEPFDAPDALLAAAPAAPGTRWADPALKDVPLCFLADGDTTGGSSGSPVLDAHGALVGVNFDRVWENVANDFGYLHEVGRNIAVDVRYLLWMLDALNGEAARPLLKEMGVEVGG